MRLDSLSLNQKAIEVMTQQLTEQEHKGFSKMILKTYCIKHQLNLYLKNFDSFVSPFVFLKNNLQLTV